MSDPTPPLPLPHTTRSDPGALPVRGPTAADRATEAVVAVLLSLVFIGLVALGGASRPGLLAAAASANVAWAAVCALLCWRRLSLLQWWRQRWVARLARAGSPEALRDALADGLPRAIAQAVTADDVARLQAVAERSATRAERADRAEVLLAALGALLAPLPLWWPLVMVGDTPLALRLVHGTGAVWLFLLGAWWARRAGVSPWLAGPGLALLAGMLGTMHAWLRA